MTLADFLPANTDNAATRKKVVSHHTAFERTNTTDWRFESIEVVD